MYPLLQDGRVLVDPVTFETGSLPGREFDRLIFWVPAGYAENVCKLHALGCKPAAQQPATV